MAAYGYQELSGAQAIVEDVEKKERKQRQNESRIIEQTQSKIEKQDKIERQKQRKEFESRGPMKVISKIVGRRAIKGNPKKGILPQKGRGLYGISVSKKLSKARQRGTRNLLGALGVGVASQAGAGRPRGTYKYGMPIQKFKRLQAQRRALAQLRAQQINQQFAKQGYTPEQVVMAEIQSGQPQQIAQQIQQPMPMNNMEDPEVAFRRQLAQTSISPNTMAMLDRIKRIQNKGAVDDIEMQRRLNERRMVSEATNLLKGKSLFHNAIDTIGLMKVDGNILTAPNIFRENPNNTHILSRRRLSILQSREAGTDLHFW